MLEAEPEQVQVVYIVGCGRSGSTVMDIVLGNCSGVVSGGELSNLARFGWLTGELCACGEPGDRCTFWREVKDTWMAAADADVDELDQLQRYFCRGRLRPWWRLMSRSRGIRLRRARLQFLTRLLYQSIARVSGNRIVVDSSKLPARAQLIASDAELDVAFIHLVRDARGVAWSLKKSLRQDVAGGVQRNIGSRRTSRTSLWWRLTNWQAARVLRAARDRRRIVVRYEEFVRDPARVIRNLESALAISLGTPDASEEGFAVGHNIAGNRARMSPFVQLRLDETWRESLSLTERRLIWLICGGPLRAFGYDKH